MSLSKGDPVTFPYPVPTEERGTDHCIVMEQEERAGTVVAAAGPAVLIRPKDPPVFNMEETMIGGDSAPTKHDRVVRHARSVEMDPTRTARRRA
jgi:hypothetical protein